MSSSVLPGSIITCIAAHPASAQTIFVTVGNTGHSHLFRSDDGGLTWRDIDGGTLPDAPHNAVAFQPDAPDVVFVASNVGVFQSSDQGASWSNVSGNLPNTMFVDLVCRGNTLTTGTYGRSIWQATLS